VVNPADSALCLRAKNLARAGFPHGFSTRAGGVSEGPFATLDFGAGDLPDRVAENVRRFARAVGFEPSALRQVTQVHGARVVSAGSMPDEAGAREEADALVLEPGEESLARAVGVRVADCVPVLLATRDRGAIAAVHAGWRGVEAGIVTEALARMSGRDFVAAIGPCIGPCCFEVGAEVAAKIARASGDARVIARCNGEKAYVDLRRAVEGQLAAGGVGDVERVGGCTKCDRERFFSFRRDGERSGRHLAVIALRSPAG
jgi:YfiH family protein